MTSGGPFGGAHLDLELRAGARFFLTLDYQDADGAAPDLTGWTARLDIRARTDIAPATTATPILKFRSSPGVGEGTITLGSVVTLDDGTLARRITLDAGADLTVGLAPTVGGREHVYDLELVNGSSMIDVLISGRVTILAEVTR